MSVEEGRKEGREGGKEGLTLAVASRFSNTSRPSPSPSLSGGVI